MIALLLLLACPPGPISDAIAAATANPIERAELHRIAQRESRCDPFVSVHPEDAWAGSRMHADAVAAGWLDPDECPAHALGDGSGWAPRGAWGVSPAWTVRFAAGCMTHADEWIESPAECAYTIAAQRARRGWSSLEWIGCGVGPEAHDDPASAAVLALAWGRLQGSTCSDRARAWVGAGTFDARPWWRRVASVHAQCGPWDSAIFALSLTPLWRALAFALIPPIR